MAMLTVLLMIAGPAGALASRVHRPVGKVLDTIPPRDPPEQQEAADRRHPHHLPQRSTFSDGPTHPVRHPHYRPKYRWPGGPPTVVREIQPIVILTPAPSQEPPPPPEPQKVWVPPVMGTRTEPGYWDYGIRKVWMGDHWRYEQDVDQPIWVPERQVEVVKQEGYWKIVE